MTPEEPAAATTDTPRTVAARPREKRLVPVPRKTLPATPPPAAEPAASRPAVESPLTRAQQIERKVVTMHDPEAILRLVHTEAVLRRAQRLSGAGEAQRQMMRLLSIGMLFAMLLAAVGAMWYLQTTLASSRSHRVAPVPTAAKPVKASQAPAASARRAGQARRSLAPAR